MRVYVDTLRSRFEQRRDPERAAAMRAYMKDHFDFFGMPAPDRRAAQASVDRDLGKPKGNDVFSTIEALWELHEREFQYAATDLFTARCTTLDPSRTLELVERLARRKSWWDTVDPLAGVGSRVLRSHQELVKITERWIVDEDFWVARLALLHQNGWGLQTDEDRLFRYCLLRADNREFFVRKAIGWALRDYAWCNPDAVARFVDAHRDALSPLSCREALKNQGKLRPAR